MGGGPGAAPSGPAPTPPPASTGPAAVHGLSQVEAARWYLERGFRPIPWVPADGKKVAAVEGFTYAGYVGAADAVIQRVLTAWAREPRWRVGLALAETGPWLALDVDDLGQLAAFEAERGELPSGAWVQESGRAGGGRHYLWRRSAALGEWPRQGPLSAEYPKLEVKSNGFIAVAPSLHPTGRAYRWVGGGDAPAELGWGFTAYLAARQLGAVSGTGTPSGTGQGWDEGRPDVDAWVTHGLPSGHHDDALARAAMSLAARGLGDHAILSLLRAMISRTALARADGWSDENLLAKVESGRRKAGPPLTAELPKALPAWAAPSPAEESAVGAESGEPPAEEGEDEAAVGGEAGFPGPGTPMRVARRLEPEWARGGLAARWHWRGTWWVWTGTHWTEEADGVLQDWLYQRLEHEHWLKPVARNGQVELELTPWNPNRRTVAEVERALMAVLRLPDSVEAGSAWRDGAWVEEAAPPVPCRNGTVDPWTLTITPHAPSRLNTSSVPFDYDPSAVCPRWLTFLEEVFPGDPAAAELLQEWFGYVVSGRTGLQKLMFLVGATRSGKSTTTRVLSQLLGGSQTAAPTLSSFGSNFGLSSLIGKALAVVDDARYSSRLDLQVVIERLLSITGGGRLDVDRKNKAVWTGRLSTRITIASNELPWFRDSSGAIVGRMLVLHYKESFLGKEDPRLETALEAELPGILNWALAGLGRLARCGRFTQAASGEASIEEMREHASPVQAFVADRCELVEGEVTSVEELFAAWMFWRGDVKDDRSARTAFGMALRAALPKLERKRMMVDDGSKPYFYEGIRLKSPLPQWAQRPASG